jgi:5'-nucleotidase
VDSTTHPGEVFPRASGLRFRYDPARPKFDVVTAIELGDLDRGYRAIDMTGQDGRLYSLTCPLYLGLIVAAIPKFSKGALPLVPKGKDGVRETKEWQAIMDHLRKLPATGQGKLPVVPVDERAAEVRAIKEG